MAYQGFTEAQAKANRKYREQHVFIQYRVTPERRDIVKAAADAAGESMSEYIGKALDMRMSGGASTVPAFVLEYVQETGESLDEFLARACKDTIDRDKIVLRLRTKSSP